MSCTSPGGSYTNHCDDCLDNNRQVSPAQTGCFAVPYARPNGGGDSFDYNCDGKEEECRQSQKATGPTCTLGAGAVCAGSGYLPNTNRPIPSGSSLNPYCGSSRWRQCTLAGSLDAGTIGCAAVIQQKEPIDCR
jgi:hypothetical protein